MEIGHVIESLLHRNRPVAIFVEDGPATYGGKMLRYASNISALIDAVPTVRYKPSTLKAQLATILKTSAGAPDAARGVAGILQRPDGVIFFLGLGSDMETLLDATYREGSSFRAQAKLVGIMNAYKLAKLYSATQNPLRADLIFEITDFDFIFPFNPPDVAVAFMAMLSGTKPLTPVLRDQAYSYDEATLLGTAIEAAADASSYADGLDSVNTFMEGYNGRGVTGSIAFSARQRKSSKSPNATRVVVGQNVGSTILRLAKYEPDTDTWVITSTAEL
jgi:hypothetical protein